MAFQWHLGCIERHGCLLLPHPGAQPAKDVVPLWSHGAFFTGKGKRGTTRVARNTFHPKEPPQILKSGGPRRGKFFSLAWNKNGGQAGSSQLAEVGPGPRPLGRTNDDIPEAFHGLQLVTLEVHHQLVAAHVAWQQLHPHLDVLPALHGVWAVDRKRGRVRRGAQAGPRGGGRAG